MSFYAVPPLLQREQYRPPVDYPWLLAHPEVKALTPRSLTLLLALIGCSDFEGVVASDKYIELLAQYRSAADDLLEADWIDFVDPVADSNDFSIKIFLPIRTESEEMVSECTG